MKIDFYVLFELVVSSAFLGLGGLLTIAIAAWLAGAEITFAQNLKMGAFLFFTRMIGIYIVRSGFMKWGRQ